MGKTYDQYCPVAVGLDRLGDRWTLLLIRDLAWYGPARFSELEHHNPGIPSALLAERLSALTEAGLLRRDGNEYEVVDDDRAIRDLVDQLAAFGSRFLGVETPSAQSLDYLARRLGTIHHDALVGVEPDTLTVRIDGEYYELTTGDGVVTITPTTDATPDVSITSAEFMQLVAGTIDPVDVAPDTRIAGRLRYLRPAA
jgi:DNA-binding HxlR family transcriptional regulator